MATQRDTILSCACDLYLADGLDGVSMRKLAKMVGVTAPALYRHYESKESLVFAVIGEAFDLFGRSLYRSLEGRTPAERMLIARQEYLDFALNHSRFYAMLYVSPDTLGVEALPQEIQQQSVAIGQFWVDRVRECMDAGLLKTDDPEGVSKTMWGHCHGLISIYLRGMLDMDDKEFRDFFEESCERVRAGIWADTSEGSRGQPIIPRTA